MAIESEGSLSDLDQATIARNLPSDGTKLLFLPASTRLEYSDFIQRTPTDTTGRVLGRIVARLYTPDVVMRAIPTRIKPNSSPQLAASELLRIGNREAQFLFRLLGLDPEFRKGVRLIPQLQAVQNALRDRATTPPNEWSSQFRESYCFAAGEVHNGGWHEGRGAPYPALQVVAQIGSLFRASRLMDEQPLLSKTVENGATLAITAYGDYLQALDSTQVVHAY